MLFSTCWIRSCEKSINVTKKRAIQIKDTLLYVVWRITHQHKNQNVGRPKRGHQSRGCASLPDCLPGTKYARTQKLLFMYLTRTRKCGERLWPSGARWWSINTRIRCKSAHTHEKATLNRWKCARAHEKCIVYAIACVFWWSCYACLCVCVSLSASRRHLWHAFGRAHWIMLAKVI